MADEADLVRQALDYIINFPAQRTDDEIRVFVEFNKNLDRLDIEKDAKAGIPVVSREPYTITMTEMFPGIDAAGFAGKLQRIERDIFDAPVLGPPGRNHSWLKKPGKGYTSSFMPEHVRNVYHDSGYNPKDIKQDVTTWITPGSFIDPAGRDKPGADTAKFPANGETITIPLDIFGFPAGTVFTATMLPNNQCNVIIIIDGIEAVNITRDSNFLSIGGVTDYFCGNPEKNAAINRQPNTAAGKAEIKKYTISKELSDFIQIVCAIINMCQINNTEEQETYSNCIFTTDNVVSARSKFMGIQSCLQDHAITADKSVHRVILHLAEMNPGNAARELRTTYLNACIKNNNTVKAHIAKAIIQGIFIQGEQHFVTVIMRNYLLDIIDAIDQATGLATNLALDGAGALDPDLYKKEILKYYAKTPINEKGRAVQSLQRLFVNCDELRGIDRIYNIRNPAIGRRTFGQELTGFLPAVGARGRPRKTRKFLNLRKMRGGARPTNEAETRALFASEAADIWDFSSILITPGSLLHHMRIILGLDDTDDNKALFEDFIFRGFNHLLYICETPLDGRLLYIYANIHRIEDLSLEEFIHEYNTYATNADVLALVDLARTRLAGARGERQDPMEMCNDTIEIVDEAAAEGGGGAQADVDEVAVASNGNYVSTQERGNQSSQDGIFNATRANPPIISERNLAFIRIIQSRLNSTKKHVDRIRKAKTGAIPKFRLSVPKATTGAAQKVKSLKIIAPPAIRTPRKSRKNLTRKTRKI